MPKKIKTERGTGKKLAQIFKVTPVTVSQALNFFEDTDLKKKIRKAAIEMGGYEITWEEGGVK